MSNTGAPQRMFVRRMRFPYPDSLKAWWNPARPEFSHVVNAASLAMPFLEPYLIETMRKAKERIADPKLQQDVDLYIGQESTHFRQHQQFNKRLADLGYKTVPNLEATLKADYDALARTRSFTFNVAYAEGFEAMALTIGHMLVEDREFLFGGADPAVASLVLWHFVEEIEHKCVTYDVFKALDGRYAWRIYGLLYATVHIIARTRQGYRAMLIEDGLWYTLKSRLALYRLLARILLKLTPRLLRVLRPGYDPRSVRDPAWVAAWWRLHGEGRDGLGQLDTTRLSSPVPIPRTA
ncbi:MAG: metal-dependent hydrolase [Alphaproteobacteria bacterium]|nr:metal-dependent hydrolase [Alphaproteobacteria bacterium]